MEEVMIKVSSVLRKKDLRTSISCTQSPKLSFSCLGEADKNMVLKKIRKKVYSGEVSCQRKKILEKVFKRPLITQLEKIREKYLNGPSEPSGKKEDNIVTEVLSKKAYQKARSDKDLRKTYLNLFSQKKEEKKEEKKKEKYSKNSISPQKKLRPSMKPECQSYPFSIKPFQLSKIKPQKKSIKFHHKFRFSQAEKHCPQINKQKSNQKVRTIYQSMHNLQSWNTHDDNWQFWQNDFP